MMTETHRRLALKLRMAVEALVVAPSPDTYNQLSKMLGAMNGAGLVSTALESASNTMNEICDRFERVGKVGLKDSEAASLRQAIAGIDGRLAQVPLNKFTEAVAAVEVYCASIGA